MSDIAAIRGIMDAIEQGGIVGIFPRRAQLGRRNRP